MSGTTDNKDIIRKADLTVASMTSNGGILVPAQAEQFIRVLTLQSKLLPLCTVEPLAAQTKYIDKIKFADQILRPGQEGVALGANERSAPTTSKVELTTKLFKGEVRLSNEALEDSIEKGRLKETVMDLIAEGVSRDVERIVISGDTASANTFLAQFDGILKQATSHVYDNASARASKTTWKEMMRLMPAEFRRDLSQLVYLTSTNAELDYRDHLGERMTALGDANISTAERVNWSGIEVKPIPLFPENLGSPATHTSAILTDPTNIHVGVWREIRIETAKDISAGVFIIVVTMRMDMKFAHEDAVTKAINIKVN